MRMWNVNPEFLCQKHLCGEHVEMHTIIGCIKKGTSIKGYIDNGLLEVDKIQKRHDDLATEMIRRGYCHKSDLAVPQDFHCDCNGYVNINENIEELKRRCPTCKERILKYHG